jgi:uncharacterized membrane protein
MSARNVAAGLILALAALILGWQLWLAPPAQLSRALAAALHLAPVLPALVLLLLRHRAAPFWGGVAALLLFCHGVTEAWSVPAARALAGAEIVLSVLLVFAASWGGLRARMARRRGV